MEIKSPNKGHNGRGLFFDFEETRTDGEAQT
jgi:hypothetical protein